MGLDKWIAPRNFFKNDLKRVENITSILHPMKTVVKILCDEEMPTVSVIHPRYEMIHMSLKCAKPGLAALW